MTGHRNPVSELAILNKHYEVEIEGGETETGWLEALDEKGFVVLEGRDGRKILIPKDRIIRMRETQS